MQSLGSSAAAARRPASRPRSVAAEPGFGRPAPAWQRRRHHQTQQQQRQRPAPPRAAAPDAAPPPPPAASAAGAGAGAAADRRAGRATYRPASYDELVADAVAALRAAMADGHTRLEVEFPSVNVDGYKGSSDLFIDANVQLALAAARRLSDAGGLRTHVVLPDETEWRRASGIFAGALAACPAASLGHLRESAPGGLLGGLQALERLVSGSASAPRGGAPGRPAPGSPAAAAAAADVFLCVNASAVELPDFESYCADVVGPGRTAVAWCLELDTLRADLGLLGFPPKALQHRFLARFLPAFYVRQRDYSKTVAVAPFIINYSGALLREYPGPWQAMLRQDGGLYACVAERRARYGLGEFKAALGAAMGVDTEEEGSVAQRLRRGAKTSTWWEDDEQRLDESDAWRS